MRIAGTPYQWVVGTKVKVASFSGYVSTLEGVTDTLGISSLSISVLMLIMQFVVAWNYFKMLMVIAERYVLLGVFPTQHLLHLQPVVLKQQIISWLPGARCLEGK